MLSAVGVSENWTVPEGSAVSGARAEPFAVTVTAAPGAKPPIEIVIVCPRLAS